MINDGLFGYGDLSNYLTDIESFNEIHINDLKSYLDIYQIRFKLVTIVLNDINSQL